MVYDAKEKAINSGDPPLPSRVRLILKTSKWCNLRCRYCYELPFLSQKQRMDFEVIEELAASIKRYSQSKPIDSAGIIWHGGEPLALPLQFYRRSQRIFDAHISDIKHYHSVQTNLTILPIELKRFLASGEFFQGLGFSIDPFGGQRVTVGGGDSTTTVLKNLDWLLSQKISTTAITVLSAKTRDFVIPSYLFFEQIETPVRFLAFYKSSSFQQEDEFALDGEQILSCWLQLFSVWLQSSSPVWIEPINTMIDYALNYIRCSNHAHYSTLFESENVVVDHEGKVWSADDDYSEEGYFGSIGECSLIEILSSDRRMTRIRKVQESMCKHCLQCRFFGACPGQQIRFMSKQQQDILENYGCLTARFLDEVLPTLKKSISVIESKPYHLDFN